MWHFSALRLFHRQMTVKICVYCLILASPWAVGPILHACLPFSQASCLAFIPCLMNSPVVSPVPSLFCLFGQACPSSSRRQAAAQAQPVSALCTVDAVSGCHLDLYVPPSPPRPMLSPCPGGSHTPQHNPWVSLISVQPAPHR